VDALRRIHRVLVPGSLVIDTQPVSAHPPVVSDDGSLGTLDMSEWARTIATIDRHIGQAVGEGLFDVEHERRFVVPDEYGSGDEFVTVTRGWAGTRVSDALAERAVRASGRVLLDQEIRLRVLRRRGA